MKYERVKLSETQIRKRTMLTLSSVDISAIKDKAKTDNLSQAVRILAASAGALNYTKEKTLNPYIFMFSDEEIEVVKKAGNSEDFSVALHKIVKKCCVEY